MVKLFRFRLSFAQWLLLWLVVINIFGGIAIVLNTAINESRAIRQNHEQRLHEVLDFLQESMGVSISNIASERRAEILGVISPVIHNSSEMDIWGAINIDGNWAKKAWTRDGGEGSLKEFLPLEIAQQLIDSDPQEMEYKNFFLTARPVFKTDALTGNRELEAHLIGGHNLTEIYAEVVPRMQNLAVQLALLVLVQLLIVSVFLDIKLRRPLARISEKTDQVGQQDVAISKEFSNLGDLARIEKATELLQKSRSEYRQQEAYLRSILETMNEGILVLDEQANVVEVNQAFVSTWGYTLDDIKGKPVQTILHPRHRAQYEEKTRELREANEPLASDVVAVLDGVDMNGREFPITYVYAGFTVGSKRMFVVTVSDISEQERQKAELVDAKEAAEKAQNLAEQAAAAKATFLANMSHEIRTPMNGVMGLLDLVGDTELSNQQAGMINTAKVSAESLLNLLNDILDISKIEAGKIDLEHTDFELGCLIEEVVTLFHVSAVEKGLELSCFVDPSIQKQVRGDPTRLRQIASNIIGNAVKFTQEGEVEVRLELGSASSNQYALSFVVRDTGIGMAGEAMTSLFDPFSQADTSTTRKFGGTGLGMAISRQLVELMGGTISAETELGTGTTFRVDIDLPTCEAEGRVDKNRGPLPETRMLVVSDNSITREILGAYLSRWGIHCELVESACTALERITIEQRSPFDICLIDRSIADMDGVALARKIAQANGTSHMVLALLKSVSADDTQMEDAGVSQTLNKPIRQAELFDLIARCRNVEIGSKEQALTEKELFEGRVLLVEDNTVNQLVAKSLLEKMGLSVDIAVDGQKSLEAMGVNDYDLVFMDCLMPVMDGYEATAKRRKLESEKRFDRLPIIALTANAMSGDRERCLAAGMDDFLSKPIKQEALKEKLRFWTGRKESAEMSKLLC